MLLSHYDISRVGPYRISAESGGAALGQAICDLLAEGKGYTGQPKCEDERGRALRVYDAGQPTRATRQAYPQGTFLANIRHVLEPMGFKTEQRRSDFDQGQGHYLPSKVRPGLEGILKALRRGHPAIFHVTPKLTRGGGHYLLAVGYDDRVKRLTYIDPNPVGEDPARDSVDYETVGSGGRWFRESYFFTGRYLAVIDGPK